MKFYLDFDGVVAHSAVECINTSFEVWLDLNNEVFKGIDLSIKSRLRKEIIDHSICNRYLVIPPENYYCLIDAIFHEIHFGLKKLNKENIEKIFLLNLCSTSKEVLARFKQDFFKFRDNKLYLQSDTDWIEENPPTKFISNFFEIIKDFNFEIYVVSRKNFKAIDKWFNGYGKHVNKIYGNEILSKFNSKFDLIKDLQKQKKFPEAVFIDDMILELNDFDWKSINVATLVAGWGYNDLKDNTKQTINIIKEHMNDLSN